MSLKRNLSPVALSLSLAVFATNGAYAAPSINKIEGSFQTGSTLTISGGDFSSVEATPYLYDSLDNDPVLSSLSDGAIVPEDEGPWSQNTNQYGYRVRIERDGDLRHSNSNAVYYGESKSFVGWPRALDNQSSGTIYVSWWYKPNQTADAGGSNKFIRVWDRSDGNGTRISWTQMHMTYDAVSEGYSPGPSWVTTQPLANQWNRLEFYANASEGVIKTWLNGKIHHDVNDFRKSNTSNGLTVGLVGFDPSIASNYSNLTFRMNDIYVSDTLARVELSNSDRWDPSSKRELLEIESWSDTEITANMNTYSHESLSGLYIYVINSDGEVNSNGYPVCDKCPGMPLDISID